MANYRSILTISLILLTCTTLYLTNKPSFITLPRMAKNNLLPLKVTLSPSQSSQSSFGSVSLLVTITNSSPNDIYLLRWSSPLDPSLPSLGLVKFTSTTTGQDAPCLDIKINHRLPPDETFSIDDESIERIPANGGVERVVEFKEPKIALGKGEEYRVKASGAWMGIWIGEGENGGGLEKLKMDVGMKTGEFESNEILVRVPGDEGAELKE